MVVVSKAIPTLLRGVSQAADLMKQPDHADIQDNADSNPILGLTKRSGLQFVTSLSNTTLGDVHIQTINRDKNERYIAIFSNGDVKVYELDGTELTVNKPDGTAYLNTNTPRSVIKTVTIADFTFVVNTSITAAMDSALSAGTDTQAIVFINQATSKTKYTVTVDNTTVTKDTDGDDPLSTDTVAESIKDKLLGQNGQSPTSGSALTGFTIAQNGPVLHIKKNDGSNFSIDGSDTQGDTKMTIVKDTVQRFTDLPKVSPNGYVVEVKGDEETNFDNYYVKFVTNNGGAFEEGQWEETVESGITFKFDYATMPHVLIRQADGEFRFARVDGDLYTATPFNGTYRQEVGSTDVIVTAPNHGLSSSNSNTIDESALGAGRGLVRVEIINGNVSQDTREFITKIDDDKFKFTRQGVPANNAFTGDCKFGLFNNSSLPKWGERTVGDLISAPNPSFIGNKINNVFFFRNRLGFLAGDNVILSRVSEFFNFFPETVISVLDSEPIDVAASHTKVAILKSAVTIGEKLVLFSDQTQFVLTASADNLTPKTANVLVATEFESSADANPVGSGTSIYFLTKKGSFAGVREYIIQGSQQIRDAANTTIHVPRLIPSGIYKMAVSNNQDILVLLGTDNPNKLYINRWLYGDGFVKQLNSWFTFTINPNRKILNVDFIGTDLFVVIEEANGTSLEKIPFETDFKEPNSEFEFHLDHKVTEETTGVSVSYESVQLAGESSAQNRTKWTLPYRTHADMTVVARYLADDTGRILKAGQRIQTTTLSTTGSSSFVYSNPNVDLTNAKVIIGEPYEMHYRFSQQKMTSGGGGTPEMISGRLQIHHFYFKFEDTGFFQVEVTPENRDVSTHKFTGRLLGAASASIGQINLDTGTFKVPIMSKSDRVNIDIKNNTFLPTRLASAEYEGVFHIRSARRS